MNGKEIVQKVSESLDKTVQITKNTTEKIELITKAAASESTSIAEVAEGIHQISAVVQTNSATSEESAAASEELSSQATLMKKMMSKFRLKRMDNGYMPAMNQEIYRGSQDENSMSGSEEYAESSVYSKY
jgi:methyl-accepting chemotaxis protein